MQIIQDQSLIKEEKNFGDIKYKTYTEEFDEIVKAEELESLDELAKLRKP